MSDLKQMFVSLGFRGVETYIQSGNVIFFSDEEQCSLMPLIEKAFEARFGFQSAVIIRSEAEIAKIIDSLPFIAEDIEHAESETPDVEHIYIYLSGSTLDAEKIGQLCAPYGGRDKYRVNGREIYLLCFQSITDSKLPAMLMKLPQPLTARNLKTMKKISSMFQVSVKEE